MKKILCNVQKHCGGDCGLHCDSLSGDEGSLLVQEERASEDAAPVFVLFVVGDCCPRLELEAPFLELTRLDRRVIVQTWIS